MNSFADSNCWCWAVGPKLRIGSGIILTGLACVALTGCAEFPEGGPNARSVIGDAGPGGISHYALVRVTPTVIQALAIEPPGVLSQSFTDSAPPPSQPIGIGDVISITIWDFGGLLSTAAGQPAASAPMVGTTPTQSLPVAGTSTIPSQAVDQDGNVTVPYAGAIHAVGLSTTALQRSIAVALKPVMIHPQVLVSVGTNQSSFVTVAGDAAHPGRVPLTLAGLRLLDAIALSGGSTALASDTTVRVTRDKVTKAMRLEEIAKSPSENIYMRTNDLIVLDREPQSVVILGATNHNAQFRLARLR